MGKKKKGFSLAIGAIVGIFVVSGCRLNVSPAVETDSDRAVDSGVALKCYADSPCAGWKARCVGTNQIESMITVDCHHLCGPGPCEGASCIGSGEVRTCPTGMTCREPNGAQATAACMTISSPYDTMDAGAVHLDGSMADRAVDANDTIDGSTSDRYGELEDDGGQNPEADDAGSKISCQPLLNRDEATYIGDFVCPDASTRSPSGYLSTDLGITDETFTAPSAINNCGAVIGQGGKSRCEAVLFF